MCWQGDLLGTIVGVGISRGGVVGHSTALSSWIVERRICRISRLDRIALLGILAVWVAIGPGAITHLSGIICGLHYVGPICDNQCRVVK